MNKQLIIFTLCIFCLLSAVGQRNKKKNKKLQNTPPEWVIQKPLQQDYYVGVSSAAKKGFSPATYMAAAQQNALSDLANAITVKIESNSVLYSIQSATQNGQYLTDEIKMSNNLQLNDFEIVGTWEDENYYWVYCRLSKEVYQQQRKTQKQQATTDALAAYLQAEKMISEQLHYDGFLFYTKALAFLLPYMGENTPTSFDGKEVDLANLIFYKISDFIRNITFQPLPFQPTLMKGIETSPDLFTFTVTDTAGQKIISIPVWVDFSASGLLRNTEVTDQNGQFTCQMSRIKPLKSIENLTFSVDMAAISRAVSDHFVRNIVKNLPVSVFRQPIIFISPTLTCDVLESVDHKAPSQNSNFKVFCDNLFSSDFTIDNENKPEFTLSVSTDVQTSYFNGSYGATAKIRLSLSKSQTIYSKTFEKEGEGVTRDEAIAAVHREVEKTMERLVKNEILNVVFYK
ncbi:MAG TPA: LPP20 family lipoprotein [Bacteroidales bacterium]|nr:LPP20 family lipoprotein [Bacteroidales bacterium]HPT52975.1 LPP20 family lipoprotein [Bacteroidales bacterium]